MEVGLWASEGRWEEGEGRLVPWWGKPSDGCGNTMPSSAPPTCLANQLRNCTGPLVQQAALGWEEVWVAVWEVVSEDELAEV